MESGDLAGAAEAVEQQIALIDREADELAQLRGSAAQTARRDEAVAQLRQQVGLAREIADALRAGDADRAGTLVDQSNALNAKEDAAFNAAGLDGCTMATSGAS